VPAEGTPDADKIGRPEEAINPGTDHVNVLGLLVSTTAIETQTWLTGAGGGDTTQPVGGVPMLVEKLQEPPVGVAGAVKESWKINHSK
jgi:hypothetical protein